jgi:hypothetical protein
MDTAKRRFRPGSLMHSDTVVQPRLLGSLRWPLCFLSGILFVSIGVHSWLRNHQFVVKEFGLFLTNRVFL